MHEYLKWVCCILGTGAVGFFMHAAGIDPDAGKLTQVGWFVFTYIVLSQSD
jgi:hypothetical protein